MDECVDSYLLSIPSMLIQNIPLKSICMHSSGILIGDADTIGCMGKSGKGNLMIISS